jgi:hypothetical protein
LATFSRNQAGVGGRRSPNFERSMSPTSRQMSSPTWSASSIGPIGMPNCSAAASIRRWSIRSSSITIASSM